MRDGRVLVIVSGEGSRDSMEREDIWSSAEGGMANGRGIVRGAGEW